MKKIPEDMSAGARHLTRACGEIEVVQYKGWNQVDVTFLDTGSTKTVTSSHIRVGTIKDDFMPSVCGVGFIGQGNHKPSESGKGSPAYDCWSHMLRRAYCEKLHAKNPTYRDCSVVEEWHNFQTFADWHEKNARVGMELDKDITVDGNKVYGPDFCKFVTPAENTKKANSGEYSLLSPDGVLHSGSNLSEFCRVRGFNVSSMSGVVGGHRKSCYGWTIPEDGEYMRCRAAQEG